MRDRRAFTLAETLITLVIIGIIAAMTVPTLISEYKKETTVTQLKRVYSLLNQGISLAKVQNGDASTWDWGSNTDADVDTVLKNIILPNFKVAKYCGLDKLGCFYNSYYLDINGNNLGGINYYGDVMAFRLEDGTSVGFFDHSTPGEDIWVDINGDKAPNKLGYDLFVFYLNKTTGKIYTKNGSCEKGTSDCGGWYCGGGCSSKIEQDGWKITYW